MAMTRDEVREAAEAVGPVTRVGAITVLIRLQNLYLLKRQYLLQTVSAVDMGVDERAIARLLVDREIAEQAEQFRQLINHPDDDDYLKDTNQSETAP